MYQEPTRQTQVQVRVAAMPAPPMFNTNAVILAVLMVFLFAALLVS